MSYLTDLLGGQPESEIEKAVDRVFLNMSIQKGVGYFFDPDRKKRKLEEQILERSLTSDSLTDKITKGLLLGAWANSASKQGLAKLLS